MWAAILDRPRMYPKLSPARGDGPIGTSFSGPSDRGGGGGGNLLHHHEINPGNMMLFSEPAQGYPLFREGGAVCHAF